MDKYLSEINKRNSDIQDLIQELIQLKQDHDRIKRTKENLMVDIQRIKRTKENLMVDIQKVLTNIGDLEVKMNEIYESIKHVIRRDEFSTLRRELKKCQDKNDQLNVRIQKLERWLPVSGLSPEDVQKLHEGKQRANIQEININIFGSRLDTIECGTVFDGKMIFKIKDYVIRRMEAIITQKKSFYSPEHFYTDVHGYKMCIRVFPNGDGTGSGSHLSVFIVVMKGEYDELLKWPFQGRVTMTLMDLGRDVHGQLQHNDVSHTFVLDTGNHAVISSIQKPTMERNIAAGFPTFVSQQQVFNGNFIDGDGALYIKIVVKTGTLIKIMVLI